MSKLTKKVALVTGGSRGIGAAIAKHLAADGATITYAKDASAASAVVKAIELAGGKAVALDATPPQVSPGELIALVTASFGPPEDHIGPSYSSHTTIIVQNGTVQNRLTGSEQDRSQLNSVKW